MWTATCLLVLFCIVFFSIHVESFHIIRTGRKILSQRRITFSNALQMSTTDSFVLGEMRKVAMKLHTRDQAREGQKEAQTPFTAWTPQLSDYLQFLVDSRAVYQCMEEICNSRKELEIFRSTGLERTTALNKDIAWISEKYHLQVPEVAGAGQTYCKVLIDIAGKSIPAFICHFYNHYFAHTAGGRMIGKKMSDMLLDGETLEFYKWEGDVKELGEAVRVNIDNVAKTWSEAEKEECLAETALTFRYGGSLLQYISRSGAH